MRAMFHVKQSPRRRCAIDTGDCLTNRVVGVSRETSPARQNHHGTLESQYCTGKDAA